jgi:hypothetical protein
VNINSTLTAFSWMSPEPTRRWRVGFALRVWIIFHHGLGLAQFLSLKKFAVYGRGAAHASPVQIQFLNCRLHRLFPRLTFQRDHAAILRLAEDGRICSTSCSAAKGPQIAAGGLGEEN